MATRAALISGKTPIPPARTQDPARIRIRREPANRWVGASSNAGITIAATQLFSRTSPAHPKYHHSDACGHLVTTPITSVAASPTPYTAPQLRPARHPNVIPTPIASSDTTRSIHGFMPASTSLDHLRFTLLLQPRENPPESDS